LLQHFNEIKFNLITSFDLFSHISSKEELILGLKNINKSLTDNGVFLWYDIYSKDHFNAPFNSESWGFSIEQMKDLASEAGFEIKSTNLLFKKFLGRYHSVYQAHRIPIGLLQMLEKIIPGTPGNVLLVLKKNKG
jgi:cyclopropane fatty-acyl-phospholipid synthase-like methyltransferase